MWRITLLSAMLPLIFGLSLKAQCPLDLGETTIPPPNNLLLYFPFDGDVMNYGNVGYSATNSGAIFLPSQCGQALSFDGVNDYVLVSPTINLANDFTVTSWITTNAQVDWMGIFSIREQCPTTYRGYSQAEFGIGNYAVPGLSQQVNNHQNCTGFSVGDRYTNAALVIPNGTPTFVAVTVQNNSSENRIVNLYMNCGAYSTSMTLDYPTDVCFAGGINYLTTIGAISSVAGQTSTLDGTVDEFRLYDVALSADQILDVYQACLPLTMDVVNYPNCSSDSSEITLFNSELAINYQLFNLTTGTTVGAQQPGNCGPLVFSTGVVTDTMNFQIEAVNSITGCSIWLDSVVTIYPSITQFYANQSVTLCQGDSILINNQAVYTAGTYVDTIALSLYCDSLITINVDVLPYLILDLGPDTTICQNNSVVLNTNLGNLNTVWQDGSTGNTFTTTQSGIYWVEVSDSCATYYDTIVVNVQSIGLDLGNDTTLCDGDQIVLNASLTGSTYLWQDGSSNATLTTNAPGQYWVEVAINGCTAVDSLLIAVENTPSFSLPADTTICPGTTLNIVSPIGSVNLLWFDGNSASNIQVSQDEIVWLTASNYCGSATDSMLVNLQAMPPLSLGNDTLLCDGDTILLGTAYPGVVFEWQDGSSNPTYQATNAGDYWVTIDVQGCLLSDTIAIATQVTPYFSLPPDTSACEGQTILINAPNNAVNWQWSDGSTVLTYEANSSELLSLTGTNECGAFTDTIQISFIESPLFDLGNDTLICFGSSININVNLSNVSVIWGDGSTNQSYLVSQEGTYYVEVSNSYCNASDSIEIGMILPPVVELGNDTTICLGDSYPLFAEAVGGSLLWQNGSAEPFIIVNDAGNYSVTVYNSCGQDSDELEVFVEECYCELYIPNAMTPDGSEFNEVFNPILDCPLEYYELRIYDRWGELIFISRNIDEGWDGTYNGRKAQIGTYVYKITYSLVEESENIVHGHLTVLK